LDDDRVITTDVDSPNVHWYGLATSYSRHRGEPGTQNNINVGPFSRKGRRFLNWITLPYVVGFAKAAVRRYGTSSGSDLPSGISGHRLNGGGSLPLAVPYRSLDFVRAGRYGSTVPYRPRRSRAHYSLLFRKRVTSATNRPSCSNIGK
jgi:hypothetical protein